MKFEDQTPKPATEADLNRRSRRAFLLSGVAALAGLGGWRWLVTRPDEGGTPWPLRRVLQANEQVSAEYFSTAHLAPVFPKSQARAPRINGRYGLKSDLDTAAWRLRVQGFDGQTRELTLADVQALPRVEMTTELKCIEGWSVVVSWAGARVSDLLARYPLATRSGRPLPSNGPRPSDLAPYAGLATPDGKYYVGYDTESLLHPQTLLCYEMNGRPLTPEHGAPLRLVSPLKYGIKYIKRIGSLAFTAQRPPDFWAERGYDWYSGH